MPSRSLRFKGAWSPVGRRRPPRAPLQHLPPLQQGGLSTCSELSPSPLRLNHPTLRRLRPEDPRRPHPQLVLPAPQRLRWFLQPRQLPPPTALLLPLSHRSRLCFRCRISSSCRRIRHSSSRRPSCASPCAPLSGRVRPPQRGKSPPYAKRKLTPTNSRRLWPYNNKHSHSNSSRCSNSKNRCSSNESSSSSKLKC